MKHTCCCYFASYGVERAIESAKASATPPSSGWEIEIRPFSQAISTSTRFVLLIASATMSCRTDEKDNQKANETATAFSPKESMYKT